MSDIELKADEMYLLRNGEIVKLMEYRPSELYPWVGRDMGGISMRSWTASGAYIRGSFGLLDIVAPWAEEDEMATKIDQQIVSQSIAEPEAPAPEPLQRPAAIGGQTYKVKTPLSEHAMYVTINDVEENGQIRPFEVFINSKNMEHYQWIVALTRLISAVLRKGGDCTFLIEELRSVFDPKGGYFKRGGRFVPSIVAEIGDVLEQHLLHIGMLEPQKLDEHQEAYVSEKKSQLTGGYPAGASVCSNCLVEAVVVMDGCATCLACADSKCG